MEPDVFGYIEAFTCLMHGHAEKFVNNIRSTMIKRMIGEDDTLSTKSKVDLSRQPPCSENLVPHVN